MGSKKDILKNLGIPEYPWSTDEDEPPSDPRPPPSTQLRPSVIAAHQHQPTASTSSPGTSGRTHVQARELFLSLLGHSGSRNGPPPYTPSTSSNRSEDMPLSAYLPRAAHTPAAELREPPRRGDLDIQRVLAFKRLTRNININNGRYSRYALHRSNTRPGSVVPSESNSSNSCNSSVRLPYYRRVSRNSINNNMPTSTRQFTVEHTHAGVLPVERREHGHSQPRQSVERRRRTHSMEVQNSDDEADVTVAPPRAVPSAPPAESPPEPENEAEAQVSSNNTSGTGVSLEEEIVEIVDEPAPLDMDILDRTRVMPSTSDPNLASTSRADEVDAPGTEQQGHGIKRKRSESADDKPTDPFTVKDFNQSLLRLLECPVCLEWMEPPMSQCRRGHLVCSRCRARLASCPVCRTTFSSVRNRAMEGVAEMLRYPCRHGCGREVRLRRRAPHEASCAARKYLCPAPACADSLPLPRDQLEDHFHSKHLHLVKIGARHHFGIKVSSEAHDNWLIMALDEFFHMKVDVDIRTWGIIVYVAYIGPKCKAVDFAYEVTIDGQHNSRRMLYRRATHSDLESSSLTVSRQDCFHLTLDQALNFIRFKNRHCDAEKFLEFDVEISKIEPPPSRDDSDS